MPAKRKKATATLDHPSKKTSIDFAAVQHVQYKREIKIVLDIEYHPNNGPSLQICLNGVFVDNGWNDLKSIIVDYAQNSTPMDHGNVNKRNLWCIGNQEEVNRQKFQTLVSNEELLYQVLITHKEMFSFRFDTLRRDCEAINMWPIFENVFKGQNKWQEFITRNKDLFFQFFRMPGVQQTFVQFTTAFPEATAWFW